MGFYSGPPTGTVVDEQGFNDGPDYTPPATITNPLGDVANSAGADWMFRAVPSSVPKSVTPRQARLALLAAGLLDKAQAAVDASDAATKITWEYATEFLRADPLINNIGIALGLTDDQIDSLFVQATAIP